jgi:hypothetical protein
MKRIIILFSACLAIMSLTVQGGDLYRWIDSAGVVHYSDVPTADAEKIDSRKFSNEAAPSENLPYETRRAQLNFPVTLYVGDGCDETCNQARSFLNKRGIPFSQKFLRTKQDIAAFKQLSGIDGEAPVLAVGKNFLKGFLESQWNIELDIAGYPKSAPYRASSMPSTPAAASQVVPANPAAP